MQVVVELILQARPWDQVLNALKHHFPAESRTVSTTGPRSCECYLGQTKLRPDATKLPLGPSDTSSPKFSCLQYPQQTKEDRKLLEARENFCLLVKHLSEDPPSSLQVRMVGLEDVMGFLFCFVLFSKIHLTCFTFPHTGTRTRLWGILSSCHGKAVV